MKKIRIRVRVIENCHGFYWWSSICDGNKRIYESESYEHKRSAIRAAKKIAKRIGIKYDPEILKLHGC